MHPVFFQLPEWIPLLGGYSIRFYGVFVALGFVLGLIYVKKESERLGLKSEKILDMFFYMAVASLLGARALFVINEVGMGFFDDPLVAIRFWEGGLVFQGGLLAAMAVWYFLSRRYKLPIFKVADVFMPALALGHAIGRIGCFFAGCCHGKVCDPGFPLAVIFPENPLSVAPANLPLYPTQLFEAGGEFLLFLFLVSYRKKKPFDGAIFLAYLMIYSVMRSIIEIYRGDFTRGFVIEPYLSNGQFIALVTFIVALFLWVYLKKKESSKP